MTAETLLSAQPESSLPAAGTVDVAYCVVNWSTPADVLKLLATADEYEMKPHWAIYWNHHEEMADENKQVAQQIHAKYGQRVTSIINDVANKGHGAGLNQAVALAANVYDPKYVFALNPDCAFVEPIADKLVEALEEDPARFAVGPKQVTSQDKITAGGIVGTQGNPTPRYWMKHDPHDQVGTDRVVGPMVSGSAFLCRTTDFYEYGGMLESHHYYSETWLMYHATAHGRECWYIGDAKLIHEWHQSTPVGSKLTDGRMKEDRELFRAKCDEHDPPIMRD